MNKVTHPTHYQSDITCECGRSIECLDIVRNKSFMVGNVIKYVWRYEQKNGLEDLHKARFYLDEMIKGLEK